MLTISDTAREIINEIADESGGVGIRLEAKPGTSLNGSGPSAQIGISLTDAPGDEDEVLELGGGRVFLEPGAAAYLEDKHLDAHVEGERVEFIVEHQG